MDTAKSQVDITQDKPTPTVLQLCSGCLVFRLVEGDIIKIYLMGESLKIV